MKLNEAFYWLAVILMLTLSSIEVTFDSGGKDEARVQVQTKKETTTSEVKPNDGPTPDWK